MAQYLRGWRETAPSSTPPITGRRLRPRHPAQPLLIGEEVIDAPITPRSTTATKQIEEAEKRLLDLAEKGRHDGGFRFNRNADRATNMAGKPSSATARFRAPRRCPISTGWWRLAAPDLIILAARPARETSLATNTPFCGPRLQLSPCPTGT